MEEPVKSGKTARNFLTLSDWSRKEIEDLLELAAAIKKDPGKYSEALKGMTLAMIFMKTSTRTRVSFEAGMTQLGGHAIYMDYRTTNLMLGELKDEIKCVARYSDIIVARVYPQKDVEAIAEAANETNVPVINALSNEFHPCQALADMMTIKEFNSSSNIKIKIAYLGDGNNTCNELIIGASKLGMKIVVATPEGYEPIKDAIKVGKECGTLTLTNSPEEAVKGADFVYTDTWVSMGQEAETNKRILDFRGYTITKNLLGSAYFMHCLPAHRGVEVTDEVIDSAKSIVFEQAANRLHTEKALMLKLLGKV